MAQIGLVTI